MVTKTKPTTVEDPVREDKKVELPEELKILLYLRREFPADPTEVHADYRTVGKHCFRLNFWKERTRDGCTSKELIIGRSLYVIVHVSTEGLYTHTVYKD